MRKRGAIVIIAALVFLSAFAPQKPAPINAPYVVTALNAELTNERALAAAAPLTLSDGGANAAITLSCATCVVLEPTTAQNGSNTTTGLLRLQKTWLSGASSTTNSFSFVTEDSVAGSGRNGLVHTYNVRAAGSADTFQVGVASLVYLLADPGAGGRTPVAFWGLTAGYTTGRQALAGMELNVFNRSGDHGLLLTRGAAPAWEEILVLVPESQCCGLTDVGYDVSFGLTFARSSHPPYPRIHVPILIDTEAISTGGYGILIRGSAADPTRPASGIVFMDRWSGPAIDTSQATLGGGAVHMAQGQNLFWAGRGGITGVSGSNRIYFMNSAGSGVAYIDLTTGQYCREGGGCTTL
jgi:hypothetical protein